MRPRWDRILPIAASLFAWVLILLAVAWIRS
jgi:hypothetical protein